MESCEMEFFGTLYKFTIIRFKNKKRLKKFKKKHKSLFYKSCLIDGYKDNKDCRGNAKLKYTIVFPIRAVN